MGVRDAEKISRKQVAYRLKCSLTQVQAFENKGKLHPVRERPDGRSRIWYSPDEVEKLAKEYRPTRPRADRVDLKLLGNLRGKMAARVFQMLDEGKDFREIVIACELDPLIVRQFWDEWQMNFDDAWRAAEKRRAADQEREEQRRHERRMDMAEWRKVKLEEIRYAREIAAAAEKKKESA
jgi:hypothetical protein